MIPQLSNKGFEVLEHYEGLKLKPYLCPAKIPTISLGVTRYPNGKSVTMTDKPLKDRNEAIVLAKTVLKEYENAVVKATKGLTLNQNQFDACVLFTYNVGVGAFAASSILKKMKVNLLDKSIYGSFLAWDKIDSSHNHIDDDGDGLIDEAGEKDSLLGLTRRRNTEATLFFTGTVNFYENLKA
jgi:lysozyme